MLFKRISVFVFSISFLGLTACDEIKLSNGGGGSVDTKATVTNFDAPAGSEVILDGNRVFNIAPVDPVIPAVSQPEYVSRIVFYDNNTGRAQIGTNIVPFSYQADEENSKVLVDYASSCGQGSSGQLEVTPVSYNRPEGNFIGNIYVYEGTCVEADDEIVTASTVQEYDCFHITGGVESSSDNMGQNSLSPSLRISEYFEMSPGGCSALFSDLLPEL